MTNTSQIQQTISSVTGASSNITQPALSLSRKAKALTQFLLDGTTLPEVLLRYAQVLSLLTSSAAVASALYYLFQKHRQDRAKTQLAIFHIIHMLEHLPDLESHLQDPLCLIADIEEEVMCKMSAHLSTGQVVEVQNELKRKVWMALDEHSRRVAKRTKAERYADGLKAWLRDTPEHRAAMKKGSSSGTGDGDKSLPSLLDLSDIDEELVDEEPFGDELFEEEPFEEDAEAEEDVDMPDAEQTTSTPQNQPAPSHDMPRTTDLTPEQIAATYQIRSEASGLRPHVSKFPAKEGSPPSAFTTRGGIARLNVYRGRTNKPLFRDDSPVGNVASLFGNDSPSPPLGIHKAPVTSNRNPTSTRGLVSPRSAARGPTDKLPFGKKSVFSKPSSSAPLVGLSTYQAPKVSSEEEEEVSSESGEELPTPAPAPRAKMGGYGLDYSDEELYPTPRPPQQM